MVELACDRYFFFFNDTATTEIYTLSLHDALPICRFSGQRGPLGRYLRGTAGMSRFPALEVVKRNRVYQESDIALRFDHAVVDPAVVGPVVRSRSPPQPRSRGRG